MTLDYLHEKTRKAVTRVDASKGSLQTRIVLAYRDSLMHGIDNAEKEQYLPAELQAKCADLKLRVESWDADKPMPEQGPIWYNVESLSYEDAEKLADEIRHLNREVSELGG